MAKVPEVSLPVWKELYAAAAEFAALEPWELFADSEIFGVHDPATGQMGYPCVLGALGEMFALCVYRGAEGFEAHRRLQSREVDMEAGDFAAIQNCLMADFADREELVKQDREPIRKLGLKFRGRKSWPLFRSHLPGYYPWYLTEAEAAFLTRALRCACDATEKVDAEAVDLAGKPGQVFCYFPGAGEAGFETRWEPVPLYQPAPAQPLALDGARLAKIRSGRWNPGQVWEVDAFHLPMPLMDQDRPYLPRSAMVIHQGSGFIIHSWLSGPETSKHQALAEAVLAAIEESGRLPHEVQVRGEEMARLFTPLAEGLGVKVVAKDRLEGVLEAKEGMEDFLRRGHKKEPMKRMDHRSMEKVTFNLSRRLREQDFESPEDANRYLHGLQEEGELDKPPAPQSAWEAAQNLMYEAFEEGDIVRRIKLARRALKICPDCADAYCLLAEETAGRPEEARDLYLKGVEAGERALGQEFFEKEAGHFWGMIESRPYMRARAELARCLWVLGDREAALGHWRELLRLNANDNQGMRYVLLARLGELGRFEEIRDIVSRHQDDCGLELLLMKALAAFALKAPPPEAATVLREACEHNKHFPDYLLKKKRLPRHLADRLEMGGETEATYAVSEALPAWEKVPGALEWAAGELKKLELPKVGRNEPCPCGSGKKYKKCCAP